MKLPVACREIADLRAIDLRGLLPPADADIWDVWDHRQRTFQVHRQTRSIAFRWLDHRWTPQAPLTVVREDYAGVALSEAVNRCAETLESHFDGKAVRLVLAELGPGCEVAPHVDRGPALVLPHRCHVPVLTNPQVEFRIEKQLHHFREGIAYEFDNTRSHSVANRGASPRVHLICDVLCGGYDIASPS